MGEGWGFSPILKTRSVNANMQPPTATFLFVLSAGGRQS